MGKTYKDYSPDLSRANYMNIKIPKSTSVFCIGDCHEHLDQFNDLIDKINPSDTRLVISLGDVYEKGFGEKEAEKITNKLIEINAYAVRGNHELRVIKAYKRSDKKLTDELKWWKSRPLAMSFEFHTGARLTCVHAGVTPRHTLDNLTNDVEICYVRDVDENGVMIPLKWEVIDGVKTLIKSKSGGKPWHDIYDGRMGYIASGHSPQKDGKPKFYKYSCNLDTGVYETGILTAQEFTDEGKLGELIQVIGEAAKPELHVNY